MSTVHWMKRYNAVTVCDLSHLFTQAGESLSKWPVSFVSNSSLPVLFFSLHIHHLQWLRDATASVSSVTVLSLALSLSCQHTHTDNKKGESSSDWGKWENTSSFNCVSKRPSGLHYPGIQRKLSCLLSETLKVLVDLFPPLLYLNGRARGFGWACQDLSKFMLHRTSHISSGQLESMMSLESDFFFFFPRIMWWAHGFDVCPQRQGMSTPLTAKEGHLCSNKDNTGCITKTLNQVLHLSQW